MSSSHSNVNVRSRKREGNKTSPEQVNSSRASNSFSDRSRQSYESYEDETNSFSEQSSQFNETFSSDSVNVTSDNSFQQLSSSQSTSIKNSSSPDSEKKRLYPNLDLLSGGSERYSFSSSKNVLYSPLKKTDVSDGPDTMDVPRSPSSHSSMSDLNEIYRSPSENSFRDVIGAPPTSTGHSFFVTNRKVVLLVCIVVFAVIGWHCCSSRHSASDHVSKSMLQSFMDDFQDFRGIFKNQSTALWRILRAGTKPIIENDEPVQPAVFIIVVPSDAVETANCVVRNFSALITELFGANEPVEFRLKHQDILMPEKVKRQIDEELNRGLSSGSRVAIVHHLEQIPSESAMMFHSFCDNDNAPYRRAVFIMTLYVDESSSSIAETDAFVERRLEALWGEQLGSNRYQPLLSRIGGSNAFIRPEDKAVLEQNKC